ncbi:hypothetical protein A9E74_02474 [Methylophaga muralis]|uniref:Uncharacterized protein n=1 Tax=Methylophaga muralis TaxID=291169 RepID=A0A1E3GQR8_9GAMM|nr:hypothetical protein A9E74_02474 [Methylophaga muralis]
MSQIVLISKQYDFLLKIVHFLTLTLTNQFLYEVRATNFDQFVSS